MNCPFCVKQCNECKSILIANTSNFHKAKTGKYGLAAICKNCKNNKVKQNRLNNLEKRRSYDKEYYKRNKKQKNENWKEWYQNNKEARKEYRIKYYNENKEKIKEKALNKYYENREEILFKQKEQYKLNISKIKKQKKIWRINNPEKTFNQDVKNRLKRKNIINNYKEITTEQWLEMMNFFNWSCAYSGITFSSHNKNEDRTTDHIIPLNNNGPHVIWNCVPALTQYNSSKQDKDMLEWYKQQEFFSEEKLNKIYEWQKYAYEKWGDDND